MELLKDYIRKEGKVLPGNILKVDSFLNHQIDPYLLNQMGKEFKRLFGDDPINKVLTIEASGISLACITGLYFNVPIVFAKKSKSSNLGDDVYQTSVYSYTRQQDYSIMVSCDYLNKDDHILIIDDFLANGNALNGLIELVDKAHATLEGIGIAIEKGFQPGGRIIREKGYHLESLAIIDSMDKEIVFRS